MPCRFPGPHPRGKFRGIWSRPTAKEEVEGDLARGVCSGGVPAPGGACSRRVPAPGGACSRRVPAPRACLLRWDGDPPLRLLLRTVRILQECILVFEVLSGSSLGLQLLNIFTNTFILPCSVTNDIAVGGF